MSGIRRDADPLGNGYKLRQGLDLHLLHYPVPMGLYGSFGAAQRPSDLFVDIPANDKLKNFLLPWRQSPDTGAQAVQLVLQIA